VQLVLAGGGATDDPEGAEILDEVREAAGDDPDVHVLLLPSDAHRTVNALQRLADIVIQKSTREGFGLTVTEGLWKGKPVIGAMWVESPCKLQITIRATSSTLPKELPIGCVIFYIIGIPCNGWEKQRGNC